MAESTQQTPDHLRDITIRTTTEILPAPQRSVPVVSGNGDLALYSGALFIVEDSVRQIDFAKSLPLVHRLVGSDDDHVHSLPVDVRLPGVTQGISGQR